MQCHKRGHRAPARCVSALLAAGALLAAAADSLGGTSQRPALQNAALSIPPALTAASVSALLAERGEHLAGTGLTDPADPDQTRPEPTERTRRATKSRSASESTNRRTSKNRGKNRGKNRKKRSTSKAPARRHGASHSRSANRSRPARHTNSYSLEHLPPANSRKAAAAVHEALSLLGVPYRWGGTTRAGFDCSGFTQHVWAAAGVKIPRTVRAQARAGTHISMNEVQPGDLVVFYPTQHHVGIYVGNGLVIDSPHTGATVRPDPVRSMPVSAVVRVNA
ncbi:cell wall-associated NlpC family hydrolase [Catenulispora sp. MAP12-49]|uniref:C40 family peptidase n=1 Tax=Catenulispora sp. MAP12-49 TaxID=3156302 RepID=UPI0035141C66